MFPVFVLVSSVEVCSLERLPKPLMLHVDVGILRKQVCLSLLSVWAVCSLYRTLYSSACVQRGEVAMHRFFCFRLLTQCLPALRTRPEENSLGSVPRSQWVSWEGGARVGVGLAAGAGAAQGVPNRHAESGFPFLLCSLSHHQSRAGKPAALTVSIRNTVDIKQSARYTLYQLLYWAAVKAT